MGDYLILLPCSSDLYCRNLSKLFEVLYELALYQKTHTVQKKKRSPLKNVSNGDPDIIGDPTLGVMHPFSGEHQLLPYQNFP
jgi:hypothetical protein